MQKTHAQLEHEAGGMKQLPTEKQAAESKSPAPSTASGAVASDTLPSSTQPSSYAAGMGEAYANGNAASQEAEEDCSREGSTTSGHSSSVTWTEQPLLNS